MSENRDAFREALAQQLSRAQDRLYKLQPEMDRLRQDLEIMRAERDAARAVLAGVLQDRERTLAEATPKVEEDAA